MQISMLMVVKRAGRPLAATSVVGPSHPSRLFHIHDRITGTRFLVDTGAEVSITPPSRAERSHQQRDFNLLAANNTEIATYGVRSLSLDLGLRRTFRWAFVIADVKQPILGVDFLRHFGLLVDVRRNLLYDFTTQLTVHAQYFTATLIPPEGTP